MYQTIHQQPQRRYVPRVVAPRNRLLETVSPRRVNWEQLADRTCPLPPEVAANLETYLSAFGQLRVGQSFDRYGWPDEG